MSLINEDKVGGIKQALLAYPSPAGASHIRPLLFGSAKDFFFDVTA
jgi:hypothetical protein